MLTVWLSGSVFSCSPFVVEGELGSGEVQSADAGGDTAPETVGDIEADTEFDTDTDTKADTDTESDTESDTGAESDTDSKTTEGIEVLVEISSDWGSGFCTNVAVANNGKSAVMWETAYEVGGSITSLWNAIATPMDPLTHFVGEQWNDTLQPGESTSYGYCAER